MSHNEGQTLKFTWLLMCRERQGQSTLEYALVLGAFLALVLGIGALWRLGAQGSLEKLAEGAASHLVEGIAGIRDIALF